jgi:hypothetical protein
MKLIGAIDGDKLNKFIELAFDIGRLSSHTVLAQIRDGLEEGKFALPQPAPTEAHSWPGNRIVGKEGGTVDDLLPEVQLALRSSGDMDARWEALKNFITGEILNANKQYAAYACGVSWTQRIFDYEIIEKKMVELESFLAKKEKTQ